jgi:hypothetical protein
MISEKIFSNGHQSFWAENTPGFSDFYNSDMVLGRRFSVPIASQEESKLIFATNIVATTHFKNMTIKPGCTIEESFIDSIPVLDIFSETIRCAYPLNEDNKKIIEIQAERLDGFYGGNLIFDPFFPGHGLMANCMGDLLYGTTLVEIKAPMVKVGRKPFNPEDFRQILTYTALNYLAGEKYPINKINLVNPRMGYIWQSGLEEFIYLISGASSVVLFESIGNYLLDLSESIDNAMNFFDTNY